ncbi:hypothetical protein EST38_g10047 [Candolleomyces aberdarensis]|uniref:Uncharacterized protein n=1 Tax=Candolleomyces aberdarensis TaxID=2316362 RepID=A0A4Q2D8D6_9AGAR|nr:hypothetical protein EST38_g10047 [Candolleomyces aberdarensis]
MIIEPSTSLGTAHPLNLDISEQSNSPPAFLDQTIRDDIPLRSSTSVDDSSGIASDDDMTSESDGSLGVDDFIVSDSDDESASDSDSFVFESDGDTDDDTDQDEGGDELLFDSEEYESAGSDSESSSSRLFAPRPVNPIPGLRDYMLTVEEGTQVFGRAYVSTKNSTLYEVNEKWYVDVLFELN